MHINHSFSLGQQTVTLETGEIANQASAALKLQIEGTVVLATVVVRDQAVPGQDFLPLTVDYVEKSYAAGRIPGGYLKREGRPTEKDTLTSRLIDRAVRPLFPHGFYNEIQLVIQVVSASPHVNADMPALLAASAALAISGVPLRGSAAGVRVAYIDGHFALNPTLEDIKASSLDLVVAGTADALVMVEAGAAELLEDVILDAMAFGHIQMQTAIQAIDCLAAQVKPSPITWHAIPTDPNLIYTLYDLVRPELDAAYENAEITQHRRAIASIRDRAREALIGRSPNAMEAKAFGVAFEQLQTSVLRHRILAGETRIDGRDAHTVRPLNMRLGLLPRAHGSALFTRGETQALAVATLGTQKEAQLIEALDGKRRERFMLHYNMPPFATGETGRFGVSKRREIGHGHLAKRALSPVLPPEDKFPYAIRVVSEILESNGSSSMATVCASCLALFDAGVPLRAQVAGVAMGLIQEESRYAILTDILGEEDHLGDMDLKVAGTTQGVTALQMDIKTAGVQAEILHVALSQAQEARLHILKAMQETMACSRPDVSLYAPRTLTFNINPTRIRDVIGRGGATIRTLSKETGASIDITEDGAVSMTSTDLAGALEAQRRIELLVADVEIGGVYTGEVTRIMDFGAFVKILPQREGLLHISQIADEHIDCVSAYLKRGQKVTVKVVHCDGSGRIRLSMKEANADVSAHSQRIPAQAT